MRCHDHTCTRPAYSRASVRAVDASATSRSAPCRRCQRGGTRRASRTACIRGWWVVRCLTVRREPSTRQLADGGRERDRAGDEQRGVPSNSWRVGTPLGTRGAMTAGNLRRPNPVSRWLLCGCTPKPGWACVPISDGWPRLPASLRTLLPCRNVQGIVFTGDLRVPVFTVSGLGDQISTVAHQQSYGAGPSRGQRSAPWPDLSPRAMNALAGDGRCVDDAPTVFNRPYAG